MPAEALLSASKHWPRSREERTQRPERGQEMGGEGGRAVVRLPPEPGEGEVGRPAGAPAEGEKRLFCGKVRGGAGFCRKTLFRCFFF